MLQKSNTIDTMRKTLFTFHVKSDIYCTNYENIGNYKMFRNLLAVALVLTASAASADGYNSNRAVVIDVQPIYGTTYTPVTQERCYETQVPVYGYNGYNQGNALAGALIGGAIGNQFGSGSGNDAMTILGAIVGANQAIQPRRGVVGYSNELHCEIVQVQEETNVLHHYQVTYDLNGVYYTINTDRYYEVGQRIKVSY